MINQFKQFLSSRDVKPETYSTDEFIQFKYNDLYYAFVYDNASPNYFRLVLPRIYEVDNNETSVLKCLNSLNKQYKAAKAVLQNEDDAQMVWVYFEQFAYSMVEVSELFATGMSVLRAVFDDFHDELEKFNEESHRQALMH